MAILFVVRERMEDWGSGWEDIVLTKASGP